MAGIITTTWRFTVLLVLAIGVARPLHAQFVTPGDVRSTVPQPRLEAPSGPQPSPEVPERIEPAVPEGGPKILISGFEITGNESFSTEKLQAVISGYVGQKLTLLEIYEAADALTRFYRDRGYVLATVHVPAQKVALGSILLGVVEGRLDRVEFEGNERYSDTFLRKQLDGLVDGEPVRRDSLEQELLLINDLPGLEARAIVKPGAEYGTSSVLIRSEENMFDGIVRGNNYGRESIGEWRVEGSLFIRNLSGVGDDLGLSVIHSEGGRLNYGRFDYSMLLNSEGTRLGGSAAVFQFDVDESKLDRAFIGTKQNGDGQDYRLSVTHPFIRTRAQNLIASTGYAYQTSAQQGELVLPAFGSEYVSLAFLTAAYNRIHRDASVTSVSALASTNFRSNDTGLKNNSQKGKFTLDVSHIRPIAKDWSVQVRASGILSLDPLMDIERFRIGGPGSVRAYPSAQLSGDQGAEVTVQVQRNLFFLDRISGAAGMFWDGGFVHRKRPFAGEQKHESLSGVGASLTLVLDNRYTLDLQASYPIGSQDPDDGKDSGRVWALLSASF